MTDWAKSKTKVKTGAKASGAGNGREDGAGDRLGKPLEEQIGAWSDQYFLKTKKAVELPVMEPLRDAAVRKLAEGVTTFEEIMRVTADTE